MTQNTPQQDLFQPVTIGALELKNRIVMAPMTRSRADRDGVQPAYAVTYYAQRASAGLIITEGTQPSDDGQGYGRTPGISTPAQIAAWRAITDAVHAQGGKIALQIMHAGRIAHPLNKREGARTVAPSAIAAPGQIWTDAQGMADHAVPHALTEDEIRATIADFAQATKNALAAGFDAVELHAANGYLPMQFLTSNTNQRADGWGGSPEGRARFVIETLQAMVEAAGPGRVGVRISPGGTYNGTDDADPLATHVALLKGIASLPLAFIHAQQTGWDKLHELKPLMRAPFILTGGMDAEKAHAALAAGQAEAIGFGNTFLSNPDLPTRLANNTPLSPPNPQSFFSPGPEGYIDYPAHQA